MTVAVTVEVTWADPPPHAASTAPAAPTATHRENDLKLSRSMQSPKSGMVRVGRSVGVLWVDGMNVARRHVAAEAETVLVLAEKALQCGPGDRPDLAVIHDTDQALQFLDASDGLRAVLAIDGSDSDSL